MTLPAGVALPILGENLIGGPRRKLWNKIITNYLLNVLEYCWPYHQTFIVVFTGIGEKQGGCEIRVIFFQNFDGFKLDIGEVFRKYLWNNNFAHNVGYNFKINRMQFYFNCSLVTGIFPARGKVTPSILVQK